MAESTVSATNPPQKTTMDPKEKFYRRFQETVTALQEEIDQLESFSSIAGERQGAIDHVLAGLSRLTNEVSDASEYIPAYDQRTYAQPSYTILLTGSVPFDHEQAIKAVTDKLNETTAKLAPRARFQFKTRNAGATTATTGMASAPSDPRRNVGGLPVGETTLAATADGSAADQVGPLPSFSKNYNEEMSRPGPNIRKPSFSAARDIGISGHSGLHIILPSSASRATSSGSVTDLDGCIVDMSAPTGTTGAPFAGLTLKDIEKSLIIAGHVTGPTHITGIRDSILVVASRQVRVHECKNVDLYLHCASHPIIEDCSGMRFAPIPDCYLPEGEDPNKNQWDQVDDFKWLKADHSPNWSVLPESGRVPEDVWTKTVPGKPGASVDDILKNIGVHGK